MKKHDLHIHLTPACYTKLKKLARKDDRPLRAVVERALNTYFRRDE